MLLVHTGLWNCGSEFWGTIGLFLVTIEVKIPAVALGLRHCCHFANTAHQSRTPNLSLGFVFPLTPLGPYGKGPTHEDTGDTHWQSPIPCTAHPAHRAESNPTSRSCTQHCLELWGGNPHAMRLVPVRSQCPLFGWGPHCMSEMQSPVQSHGSSSPPRMEEVTQPCCSLQPHRPALLFLPPPTKG